MHIPPLWVRLTIGLSFFFLLGTVDLLRHGRAATRWREYAFLLLTTLLLCLYGMLNDQVTVTISPEYFAYGKGLADKLGRQFDRGPLRWRWEAAKVGAAATWGGGLIMGVVLLLANNPSKQLPRLRYRQLFGFALLVLASSIICSVVLGLLGYHGLLAWFDDDFREMVRRDQFRPYRFMAVYGVHCGGYVGGILGTIIATILVRRKRAAK
jgi:hypothetical protein